MLSHPLARSARMIMFRMTAMFCGAFRRTGARTQLGHHISHHVI
jgi:hypothetical protein